MLNVDNDIKQTVVGLMAELSLGYEQPRRTFGEKNSFNVSEINYTYKFMRKTIETTGKIPIGFIRDSKNILARHLKFAQRSIEF